MDGTLHTLEIGKAEILKEGTDLAIIAIGHPVHDALEAAKNLEEDENISAAVVNARFVKPLDPKLILTLSPPNRENYHGRGKRRTGRIWQYGT